MRGYQKVQFVLAVAAVVLSLSFHPSVVSAAEETIRQGIHIGSIDVGGMTEAEAESAVEEYVASILDTTFVLRSDQGSMELSARQMGVSADSRTSVQEAFAICSSGNLIERFKEKKVLENGGYTVGLQLTVDRQKTANLIYEKRLDLGTEAEDNRVVRENGSFTFIEGRHGVEVDIVESVYAIEEYLANWREGTDNEIALVMKEVEPRGSQEELSKINDVLGEFSTDFGSSSYERATNVKAGASKINGTILYPGDEFSVYEAVSPFTKENGYELAGSYANGTVVESFGGGICQVSTTLYNAVIRAELEVLQRYNHSMTVSYVELSEDAAIAGTYKDFRFRNSLDTPIYIQGYCEDGVIHFIIYGQETRPANRKVSFESEVLATLEPSIQIETTSAHDLGYISVSDGSHTGYEAQLWKVVTVDGIEQSREVFNHSTYRASARVITVGTAGASGSQLDAIYSAASSGSESKVREAVNNAVEANRRSEEKPTETQEVESEAEVTSEEESEAPGRRDDENKNNSETPSKPKPEKPEKPSEAEKPSETVSEKEEGPSEEPSEEEQEREEEQEKEQEQEEEETEEEQVEEETE